MRSASSARATSGNKTRIRNARDMGGSQFDDRLHHASFRFGERWEDINEFVQREAVGNPGSRVDAALFDEADDAREVGGQGVAGAEQRALALVEDGVAEPHLVGSDADEDEPPALRDQA